MEITKIKRLIFDADDTLWENNIHYIIAAEDLVNLISKTGVPKKEIENEFQVLEKKVVREKGYGSQNYLFILRTLFEQYIADPGIQNLASDLETICSNFESHVHKIPKIFPEVPSVLEKLSKKYQLYVLTKGNIKEQKRKLEKSDLLQYFEEIFIEPEKNMSTYVRIMKDNRWKVDEICMIGNSPKSDINPALQLGMCAVFIPYQHTWILDNEPLLPDQACLKIVESIRDLPSLFIKDN